MKRVAFYLAVAAATFTVGVSLPRPPMTRQSPTEIGPVAVPPMLPQPERLPPLARCLPSHSRRSLGVINAKAIEKPAPLRQTCVEAAMKARFSPIFACGVRVQASGLLTYSFGGSNP